MMQFIRRLNIDGSTAYVYMLPLLAAFLIAIGLGVAAASGAGLDMRDMLSNGLESYANPSGNTEKSGQLLRALMNHYKYLVIIIIGAFSALGLAVIPAAVMFKGFSMAYSAAVLIHSFGTTGLFVAFGAVGVHNLIMLPGLMFIGSEALYMSLRLVKDKGKRAAGKQAAAGFIRRVAVCAALFAISALVEAYLSPLLISVIV